MSRYSLILVCLFSLPVAAEVYKWVDEKGNIIYSDTPHPGAEEITVDPQIIESQPAPRLPRTDEEPAIPDYSVKILQPESEQTFRDNQGAVSISVAVEPAPSRKLKHRVEVRLDGKPLAETGNRTSFALTGLERGSHTVSAVILDESGKTLASASAVTFHMHRTSVNIP